MFNLIHDSGLKMSLKLNNVKHHLLFASGDYVQYNTMNRGMILGMCPTKKGHIDTFLQNKRLSHVTFCVLNLDAPEVTHKLKEFEEKE